MVSYRVKKKLADRTCIYCEKEFQYPYIFKRHKITRCWIEGSMKSNNGSKKSSDGLIDGSMKGHNRLKKSINDEFISSHTRSKIKIN
jgi:hypothetical protein